MYTQTHKLCVYQSKQPQTTWWFIAGWGFKSTFLQLSKRKKKKKKNNYTSFIFVARVKEREATILAETNSWDCMRARLHFIWRRWISFRPPVFFDHENPHLTENRLKRGQKHWNYSQPRNLQDFRSFIAHEYSIANI